MPYTAADVISGRIRLPEPFQTRWLYGDDVGKTAALLQGLAALAEAEAAQERAVVAEEKLKEQLAPIRAAAAELKTEQIRKFAPPTILAVIAGWVAVVVAGVTVWKFFHRKKGRA
jgi:hypothetical protein